MSSGLKTAWLGQSFEHFDELGSTNTYLKENARRLPHGAAISAERQVAGKGRLGRSWQHDSASLAMSFLLHGQNPNDMPLLPLVSGVAVMKALEVLSEEKFGLKWSNDVLYNGKKICGILCESRISGTDAFAIVGIGVNIAQSREDFDRLGLVYATSLKLATGKFFEILPVAYEILNQFEPVYENFKKNGFSAIMSEYKENCVTLGKEICVTINGSEFFGVAKNIAEDGGLICESGGEKVIIRAGEARVRGLYGYV